MGPRRPASLPGALPCIAAVAAVLFAAACSSIPPVRVEPRSEEEFQLSLDTCALYGDAPSARTSWVLRLTELEDEFDHDPVGTLRLLHARAIQEPRRDPIFALAELSYLTGKRLERQDCYLAAAAYAYLFLLGNPAQPGVNPYDRRFRWACDIYNRSLVRALEDRADGSLHLVAGQREVPGGSIDMSLDLSRFPFEQEGLALLKADDLRVVGLKFRIRDAGLGAPLIAVVQRRGEGSAGMGILDQTSVPATLFLRFQGGLRDFAGGIPAALELHSTYDASAVDVAGSAVPLESDPSAALAYSIEKSDLWRFDLAGLFQGQDARRKNGLILLRPFQSGRIPVVLVHGTASSPAYWAELLNAVQADPLIRSRFQFWLFIYTTGNPVVYSAATLRESLQDLVRERDPDGTDEALKHMVVVGHSQGGLLTKLTGIHMDADDAVLAVLGTPLDELELDAEAEHLLRRCFDVEPLPFVDRLVFMATPHRGSFLAGYWFSHLLAKLIAVPGEIADTTNRVMQGVPKEKLPPGMGSRVPTSLDNMDPSSPALRYLAGLPIDPRIHVHSIIPIDDAEEPAGADDGVVEYESAHLSGVDSEVTVPSKHSCQSHPRTLVELRRILHEHLRAVDAR